MSTITLDIVDKVAVVTLSRPERLNAFNVAMREELIQAFDRTDADDDIRAVIVTGAGRAFCAGADLSGGTTTFGDPGRDDAPDAAAFRDGGGILTMRIFASLKPVIAAVNGPAVGIGATMQLPMDVRIASTEASFGFVFTRLGLVPEAASSWYLPRIVGISRALEWCYAGQTVAATEALEAGLVRSLHAPDQLLPAAHELAQKMVRETAPVSVSATRQLLWQMLGASNPLDAHLRDSALIYERGRSSDIREGISAYRDKRAPHFPDRVSQRRRPVG